MEGAATQLVIHTPEPSVKRRMQPTQPVSPGFNGSGNMYRSLFHQVGNRWGTPATGMQPGEAAIWQEFVKMREAMVKEFHKMNDKMTIAVDTIDTNYQDYTRGHMNLKDDIDAVKDLLDKTESFRMPVQEIAAPMIDLRVAEINATLADTLVWLWAEDDTIKLDQ